MRSIHGTSQFAVLLSCCGTQFKQSRELADHMKKVHHAEIVVET